ncbi:MAG: RDD family protein [Pseudomonadota bacterium]
MTTSRDPNSVIYVGFWKRALAYLIDALVLFIPLLILEFFVNSKTNLLLNSLIRILFSWIYNAGLNSSSWQATVGKKVLGIIVVDEYGERISFARATGRFLAEILSALLLFIGFMMVGWTKHKQGLHDKIAKTFVIKK